jgi:hypothetical protein
MQAGPLSHQLFLMIYSILTASTDNRAQRHATAPVGAIGGFGVAALAGAILFVAQRRR